MARRISQLWITLFHTWLFSFCAGQGENETSEIHGRVSPGDADGLYLYVGEDLTLNCTLEGTHGYSAQDLQFFLHGFQMIRENHLSFNPCRKKGKEEEVIPSENLHIVDDNTLQVNRSVTSETHAGVYACFLCTSSGDSIYVDEQTVYVQEPPRKVQNVSCFVYNWDEALNCVWDLGVTYFNMNQSPDVAVIAGLQPVRFSAGGTQRGPTDPCPEETAVIKTGCVWANFRVANTYLLNVTVKNLRRQTAKSAFLRLDSDELIKPAPVIDLHVKNRTSECVVLEWSHSRIHRPKYYKVYHHAGSGEAQDRLFDTSTELCGFRPYTTHTFVVQCHPNNTKGFWSEPASITVTTEEAEPESSFPVVPGSYIKHPCRNGQRNVTVFWKNVPSSKSNGEIIGYLLIINDHKQIERNVSSPTSAVIPDVPCNSSVSVRIFARTRAGVSKINSRIQILPEDGLLLDLAVNTTGRIHLVWNSTMAVSVTSVPAGDMSDEADLGDMNFNGEHGDRMDAGGENVTVFWCPGKLETKECEGTIQWVTHPVSAEAVELPLANDHPKNYLFGISLAGRAIMWTECLFQEEAHIDEPSDVGVSPGSLSGQLVVTWKFKKCSYNYPVRVTGFQVNVCDARECQCEDSACPPYTSYMVHGADSFDKIVNGTPGAEYGVTVEALTATRKSSPSSVKYGKSRQNPDSYLPDWAISLIVLLVSLVIVSFACIGWRCKQHYKAQEAKFMYRIVKPKPKFCPSVGQLRSLSSQPLTLHPSAATDVIISSPVQMFNIMESEALPATNFQAPWPVGPDIGNSADEHHGHQYAENSGAQSCSFQHEAEDLVMPTHNLRANPRYSLRHGSFLKEQHVTVALENSSVSSSRVSQRDLTSDYVKSCLEGGHKNEGFECGAESLGSSVQDLCMAPNPRYLSQDTLRLGLFHKEQSVATQSLSSSGMVNRSETEQPLQPVVTAVPDYILGCLEADLEHDSDEEEQDLPHVASSVEPGQSADAPVADSHTAGTLLEEPESPPSVRNEGTWSSDVAEGTVASCFPQASELADQHAGDLVSSYVRYGDAAGLPQASQLVDHAGDPVRYGDAADLPEASELASPHVENPVSSYVRYGGTAGLPQASQLADQHAGDPVSSYVRYGDAADLPEASELANQPAGRDPVSSYVRYEDTESQSAMQTSELTDGRIATHVEVFVVSQPAPEDTGPQLFHDTSRVERTDGASLEERAQQEAGMTDYVRVSVSATTSKMHNNSFQGTGVGPGLGMEVSNLQIQNPHPALH